MLTKFACTCRTCGKSIAAGTDVNYSKFSPRGQKIQCLDCHNSKGADSTPPVSCPAVEPIEFETMTVPELLALDSFRFEPNRELLAQALGRQSNDWKDGHTQESARELVSNPPAALLEKIERQRELVSGVLPPVRMARRLRRNLDEGDEIDLYKLSRNDLDTAWTARVREPRPARIVNLGISLGRNSTQDAASLLWPGVTLCALADHLTSQGASVGIAGFCSSQDTCGDGKIHTIRLDIVSPDQPLDVARIAPLCASIAVLRLVILPVEAMRAHKRINPGIGRAIDPPAKYLSGLDFFIPSDITTEAASRHWIERTLAEVKAA